jgi:hypothetical protein
MTPSAGGNPKPYAGTFREVPEETHGSWDWFAVVIILKMIFEQLPETQAN